MRVQQFNFAGACAWVQVGGHWTPRNGKNGQGWLSCLFVKSLVQCCRVTPKRLLSPTDRNEGMDSDCNRQLDYICRHQAVGLDPRSLPVVSPSLLIHISAPSNRRSSLTPPEVSWVCAYSDVSSSWHREDDDTQVSSVEGLHNRISSCPRVLPGIVLPVLGSSVSDLSNAGFHSPPTRLSTDIGSPEWLDTKP